MLKTIFNYTFKNPDLLAQALTHPSNSKRKNYQKLEFLGDRILSLVIAEYLYSSFPNEKEGDLAKRHVSLVRGETLVEIAKSHDLSQHIIMSQSERLNNGGDNKSALEDALEAILAAIYLDSGDFKQAEIIILALWKNFLNLNSEPPQDPKSELQELLQSKKYSLPIYEVTSEEGPSHSPTFTIKIIVENLPEFSLEAPTKKIAERDLAEKMLGYLKSK